MGLTATFHGNGRRPKCPPNPDFPDGIVLDMALGSPGCSVSLTYPAPSCGLWVIECPVCGLCVGVTAASRADDPKTVTIPCKIKGNA